MENISVFFIFNKCCFFVVDRLLVKNGANVNSLTQSGDTPCHLAAYRGNSHAVQVLVEEGADLNTRNRKCHRPVDEAEANGHFQIVEYLTAVSSACKLIS